MKNGFIGQQIGKLAIIGIYILMVVVCAIFTSMDIQSANVPVGFTVVDASLTAMWALLVISEIVSYVKWRKLVFAPDTVCITTVDREITVTSCKELKDILSILARHADLFKKGKIGLAMELYNPENECVEFEHIPLEEYLVDQKPTVDEKSPK